MSSSNGKAHWDWLAAYRRYTEKHEAPPIFHFWIAMAGLGHVLGRKVWLDQFFFKVYPGQIMVVLVSPSAVSRKTTCLSMVRPFMEGLPEDAINLLPNKLSPASLYDCLDRGDRPSVGLIMADELGALLNRERYAQTLATDITELNTAGDAKKRRTMRTREVELHDICLGMMATTTPRGLADEVPKAAVQAGLVGRMMMVYQDESSFSNSLIVAPPLMTDLKHALGKDLHRISAMTGQMTFTEDAAQFYDTWYNHHKATATSADDLETGWLGRKHEHVLRAAMVMSAARDSSRKLTLEIVQQAIQAVDQVQAAMPSALREVGSNPITSIADRILSVLIRMGGQETPILHGDLCARVWRYASPMPLREAIDALVQAGKVAKEPRPKGGMAYTVTLNAADCLAAVPD